MAQAPDTALARFPTFQHVVDLVRANRDGVLLAEIDMGVRLVSYRPGFIEFEPSPKASPRLAQTLAQRLQSWTGVRWGVTMVADGGAPTSEEERTAATERLKSEAREMPLVAAILKAFPKAEIGDIRSTEEMAQAAAEDSLAEVEDEWDPFEDE